MREATMQIFKKLVPSAPHGRFAGIDRLYRPDDVLRLRGYLQIQHTLAEVGANRLWRLLHDEPYVAALGAASGNQAMQMVKAGLKAIYLSGWQVAADNNIAGTMYPDQSLYPSNSGPVFLLLLLRVPDDIQEPGILVRETVVVLPPHGGRG
jgi:isocitrate lyase